MQCAESSKAIFSSNTLPPLSRGQITAWAHRLLHGRGAEVQQRSERCLHPPQKGLLALLAGRGGSQVLQLPLASISQRFAGGGLAYARILLTAKCLQMKINTEVI